MNKNVALLKELHELKMKINDIIDRVHENMREENEDLLLKYDCFESNSDAEELDVISNSSNESNDQTIEPIPNFMDSIIDKTNESLMNPIIHNKIPWIPPKNIHNKHK